MEPNKHWPLQAWWKSFAQECIIVLYENHKLLRIHQVIHWVTYPIINMKFWKINHGKVLASKIWGVNKVPMSPWIILLAFCDKVFFLLSHFKHLAHLIVTLRHISLDRNTSNYSWQTYLLHLRGVDMLVMIPQEVVV